MPGRQACLAEHRPRGPQPVQQLDALLRRAPGAPGRTGRRAGPRSPSSSDRTGRVGARYADSLDSVDERSRTISTAWPTNRALVIENDPTDDTRRLGDWLTGGRPRADRAPPARRRPRCRTTSTGTPALVVLGGEQNAYRPTARPARRPFPAWRDCCARRCGTGCRRWASAWAPNCSPPRTAARSARSAAGPEIGARLVGKRDAADDRPAVRARCRSPPDVLQWHRDEITELPLRGRAAGRLRRATRTRRSGWATGPGACSSTSSATPR